MIYTRKGHMVMFRSGAFKVMMEAGKETVNDIIDGSPHYHPIRLTASVLEKCEGVEKLKDNTYQLFMLYTYNIHTNELRHDGKLLFIMEYLWQLQDLHILISGEPLKFRVVNKQTEQKV